MRETCVCVTQCVEADPQRERVPEGGYFNLLAFFNDHQHVLPIHTLVYRADVGSMKGASACVESVFSGVKRLLGDFTATMSSEILEMYVFVHYNWQYEFMRPTIKEIVDAYIKIYGTLIFDLMYRLHSCLFTHKRPSETFQSTSVLSIRSVSLTS